ncbi:MAG TPA: universal stress protein [Candidatus Acidoferrum sp.]|nr:universal stress protein [Candidatus Acidoferrum sp.]
MIKSILVPGLNAVADPKALELALKVARLFAGHIDCLHIHPDAGELARYSTSLDIESGVFSSQIWESLVAGDKICAAHSRKIFDAFYARENLGTAGAVTAAWHEVEGNARDQTVEEAYYNDLVVFGRPPKPDDLTTNGVGDVLVGSGRPILLAPSDACAHSILNVAIGWKNTATSARAVSAALPLLAKAEKIHVLHIVEDRDQDGRASAERLAEYLRRHGLKPQVGILDTGERSSCDTLLEAAERKLHAGLLVMGAYGHSRAREFIFGGFTRTVLHGAPLPVLLSH